MPATTDRPAKRAKLLDDDSDSDNGVKLNINAEFARRFEHNEKRKDQHRLEEKYGATARNKRGRPNESDDDDDDESTDESEDDDAEFATAEVDAEILATLNAIRNKDPRVYDDKVQFYKEFDTDGGHSSAAATKKEKPMYLQDFHRENLLAGHAGGAEDDNAAPQQTYQQEQDALKRDLVGAMHAAGNEANDDNDDSDDGDFLVAKSKPRHQEIRPVKSERLTEADIEAADKDPERYLSNFMAARAWLPTDGARFQPLESDDSGDDTRADEFEEAYNMRFEDPAKANEKLQSFARDVGKFGVRREEKSTRQKARERERERKEAERGERNEEKARLRKLKIEEAEEKVKRIREAAGLRGRDINLDEWRDIIEGDFDDDKWEHDMLRRFGEDYYADGDDAAADDDDNEDSDDKDKPKRKPKKPKWDDDIEINDLVPDFSEGEQPKISLSDSENDEMADEENDESTITGKAASSRKARAQAKLDAKRAARKERQQIESIVDASLPLAAHSVLGHGDAAESSSQPATGFRYRETSPTSFGMSARDILFADDSQLNSFAGLKKLAAFRDAEKKRRDHKRYSKKARLKSWRRETFGTDAEPTGGFERILGSATDVDNGGGEASISKTDKKNKKRRSKKKASKE